MLTSISFWDMISIMKNNKIQCAGCERRFFCRLRRFVYARSRRSAYTRVGRTAVCPGCYERTRSADEQGWPLNRPPYRVYSSRLLAEASPIETRMHTVRCAGCTHPTNTDDRRWAYTVAGRTSVCEGCYDMTQSADEQGWRGTKGPYTLYASLAFAEATVIRQVKRTYQWEPKTPQN